LRDVQLLLGAATYYPRTPCRTSCLLPVPPPLRRNGDREAAP
jgi:hypothetical protein